MVADVDDDDDWIELDKGRAVGPQAPDCSMRLTLWAGSNRARATVSFRREAAAWIAARLPRFRIEIGGASAEKIRITPDAARGRFEAVGFKGTYRISLGSVSAWPAETRDVVALRWVVKGVSLILTLPDGYTKPTAKAATPPPAPSAPQSKPGIPITTRAAGLEKRAVAFVGEPAAGRSALDQKRGAK